MDAENNKVTCKPVESAQPGFDPKKLSVIIPVFNEEKNIRSVLNRIRQTIGPEAEIIVVDDGSTDSTPEMLRDTDARVIRHPYNKGNGAAVKTGIRHAKRDYIVLMDGDGQHRPEDIPKLVARLEEYDMAVGARDRTSIQSFGRKVYNKTLNVFAGYIAGRPIPDLTSGFRAIRRKVARGFLHLLPNTFSYPTTITLSMIRAGFSIDFVPLTFDIRRGESKIRPIRDGFRFLVILLRISSLFAPLKVFLPVSIFFLLGGLGHYAYTFIIWRRFTNFTTLMLSTAVIVFMLGLVAEQISLLRFDRYEDES